MTSDIELLAKIDFRSRDQFGNLRTEEEDQILAVEDEIRLAGEAIRLIYDVAGQATGSFRDLAREL